MNATRGKLKRISKCFCLCHSKKFHTLRLLASELLINQDISYEEICIEPKVISEVLKQITNHGLSMGCEKFEIPKAISLLPEIWTPDSGLVTAAMKLKRKEIESRFANHLNIMYASKSTDTNRNNLREQPNKSTRIAPA